MILWLGALIRRDMRMNESRTYILKELSEEVRKAFAILNRLDANLKRSNCSAVQKMGGDMDRVRMRRGPLVVYTRFQYLCENVAYEEMIRQGKPSEYKYVPPLGTLKVPKQ